VVERAVGGGTAARPWAGEPGCLDMTNLRRKKNERSCFLSQFERSCYFLGT